MSMNILNIEPSNNHAVMPGLVPGIHAFLGICKDVDGRDKPCHDDEFKVCLP